VGGRRPYALNAEKHQKRREHSEEGGEATFNSGVSFVRGCLFLGGGKKDTGGGGGGL